MSLRTYQFGYSIDGVHTLVPSFFTIQARSYRKAKKTARRELDDLVKRYRRGYWVMSAPLSNDAKAFQPERLPGWYTKGRLYPGCRLITRPIGSIAAFTSFVIPFISSVIKDAPIMSELFGTATMTLDKDQEPSIPTVVTYSL